MHCVKKIAEDLVWVGASDRRLALFENVYPIPKGISYNAYVLLDEKTVLLDTVDQAAGGQFFENLAYALNGRTLDYVVINHMEPDHSATLGALLRTYPETKIVCSDKILTMIEQFFRFQDRDRVLTVKEGDTLETGRHTLTFVMAPMVHWPEVMVTYDITDKTLFSADAFGSFGALNGSIFADTANMGADWMDEFRRYYVNIVGKYGPQVQALLKKAEALEIERICPLHGPVWRSGMDDILEKYQKWSTYTPEETGVLILYASVYGGTENAANILAGKLAECGVTKTALYDVSVTDASYLVGEAFKYSHIVFASTTYNAGIFVNMENLLHDLAAHNLQNRTVAVMENGSWAPTAGKLIRDILAPLKNMTILDDAVTIRSRLKPEQETELQALACAIASTILKPEPDTSAAAAVDPSAMFKLTYGLFVLTAREGNTDNGCIINTAQQISENPKHIAIAVNKANKTHDMILKTGEFNVSILTTSAPFKLFKHFGFQSGQTVDKFADFEHVQRSANGLYYLDQYANACLSGKVVKTVDQGSHTLFIAELTEAIVLSDAPSVTYAYYFEHIKPSPKPAEGPKKGYVCKICGYVYEGETLPDDFVCPLCKHGAEDFEPIK